MLSITCLTYPRQVPLYTLHDEIQFVKLLITHVWCFSVTNSHQCSDSDFYLLHCCCLTTDYVV